jgi:murein DD-endopeptidase MepM/ murein hydrolase activator NlpD
MRNFFRILAHKAEVSVMPRYGGRICFNVRPRIILVVFAFWLAATFYCLFLVTRHLDYKVTKAESVVMKAKLAAIAQELAKNREYIKRARDTDKQMRQMLGMGNGKYLNLPKGIESGKESAAMSVKDIFAKNSKDIDERAINELLKETSELALERVASFQEIAWYYANERNIYDATPSVRPCGGRITSGFGYRLSPLGARVASYHYGLDFADKANSPVSATADGIVRQAGWAAGYGQTVLIDHGLGYSTLYGHLANILVKKGEVVKKGQTIASIGTTGRSTGVHLHYEVWRNGVPVNPRPYFK